MKFFPSGCLRITNATLNQRYIIKILLLLTVALVQSTAGMGQKRVEWIYSDYVEYDQQIYGRIRRAIGSVQFRHEGTYLFCDSAYFYEDSNKIEAYSNIHIQDSDTLNLFGDYLLYLPESGKAVIRENVVLADPQVSLTTDELTYDIKENIAFYENGGTIVSKTNTLRSKKGWYYTDDKLFVFEKDVELEHPQFVLYSDTLHYDTQTELAYIFGQTNIISDENDIYAERGIYDTQKDYAQFWKEAWLTNQETTIAGDSMEYDRKRSFARAYRHVIITDTINDYIMGGEFGEYDELTGYTFLTDSAWAMLMDESDTLTLRADTLMLTFDSLQQGRTFTGYFDVRFYRSDIQGACDSILYLFSDSTIFMFNAPVIWFGKTQVVGDTIIMYSVNQKISRVVISGNAFIISDDIGDQYNQVKGKSVTGYFEDDELRKMYVHGNTETVYYLRDDQNELIGIDKAVSDRLRIEFREGEVELIVYISKVQGTTYPEKELPTGERQLKGFLLRKDERPQERKDIFLRNKESDHSSGGGE